MIYFRLNEHGVFKALRNQVYQGRTRRIFPLAQHTMFPVYGRAPSKGREGDIYAFAGVRARQSFSGYHYEPFPAREVGVRVARVKHLYSPEEIKFRRQLRQLAEPTRSFL